MQSRLQIWGYDAQQHACTAWLQRYRLGDCCKDGNVATYVLAKQDLLRWHHVENLSETSLQERYRQVHGLRADAGNFHRWVTSQKLPSLENNEETHNAPHGQWLLDRLQNGAEPEDLVKELLEKFLVKITAERLRAYRYYREQSAGYMTELQLEVRHWEYLCGQVSLDARLGCVHTHAFHVCRSRHVDTLKARVSQLHLQLDPHKATKLQKGLIGFCVSRGFMWISTAFLGGFLACEYISLNLIELS